MHGPWRALDEEAGPIEAEILNEALWARDMHGVLETMAERYRRTVLGD